MEKWESKDYLSQSDIFGLVAQERLPGLLLFLGGRFAGNRYVFGDCIRRRSIINFQVYKALMDFLDESAGFSL